VHEFAAAVVPFAGIAFGVLVGERRSHRFHHRRRDEILAGDELQAFTLAPRFVLDRARDVGVRKADRGHRPGGCPVRPVWHRSPLGWKETDKAGDYGRERERLEHDRSWDGQAVLVSALPIGPLWPS